MNDNKLKEADNTIIQRKQRINKIDDMVDIEKSKIKKYSDMQENYYSLSKNIDKCIDLISRSIKGPNTVAIFDEMQNDNRKQMIETTEMLDSKIKESKDKVNKLYSEKNELIQKKYKIE